MINKYNEASQLYDEKDYKKSYSIFYILAKNGDIDSQKNIANMLLHGLGIEEDEEEAYRWYKRVADTGDSKSQYAISNCYIHGLYGFSVNYTLAVEYLKKASKDNYMPAKYDLSIMYFNGNGVIKDKNKARELLEVNTKNGHKKSMKLLALYYLKGEFGFFKIFQCFKYLKMMTDSK